MKEIIRQRFLDHLAVAAAVANSDILLQIEKIALELQLALARAGLPAIALTVDTSILTAVGNDYGYDKVFVRQVQALACPGDVLVGISTSGNSANVVEAVELAKSMGVYCVGMTAAGGGKMKELCDECIAVPAQITARAQEMHILIGHILCELVDGE